jgi:uncharacterized membrane protein
MELRQGSVYVLTQFVGGMAAPLFLFMAGMTSGFQMEGLQVRQVSRLRRWVTALNRGAYILALAYLFRLTNFLGSWSKAAIHDLLKVDILNCMGLALLVFSVAALFEFRKRVQFAIAAALLISAAAPLMSGFSWDGVPLVVRDYLVPSPERGRFPFFPCAAYVGFGLAAGSLVKRTTVERMDRMMQWAVLIGFGLVFGSQYFANLPYSIYAGSDFWRNSPALILIRTGIDLLILAGAYLWTHYCARPGWSWMENLGKTSLLVYWVHVMLVYGNIVQPLKRALTIQQAALATVFVMLLMIGLAEVRLRWKTRYRERWRAGTTPASAQA